MVEKEIQRKQEYKNIIIKQHHKNRKMQKKNLGIEEKKKKGL
jgi:hypothetical protein